MTRIDLAWDNGITDGDPGDGRIRVNAASIRSATHLLVNVLDRHEADLGSLLSGMAQGDVLHVERPDGAGLIVAWVLGPVVHGGSYYKIPVTIRSVEGAFAAHDLVRLHRQAEISPAPPAADVAAPLVLEPGLPDDLESKFAAIVGALIDRIADLERCRAVMSARLDLLERHAVVEVDTSLRQIEGPR